MKNAYKNNKLQIEIALPLVERDVYPLYRLNKLPAPQIQNGTHIGFLYIDLQYPYLLIDKVGFKLMDKDELKECSERELYQLCPRRWFTFDKEKRCEHQLLFTQSISSLQLCDVIFEKTDAVRFIKIRSTQAWIFIAPKPSTISLKCGQELEKEKEIEGIGHLYVNMPCIMGHGNRKFEMSPGTNRNWSNIIIPNFNLTLVDVSPTFTHPRALTILEELIKTGNKFSVWALNQAIITHLRIDSKGYANSLMSLEIRVLATFTLILLTLTLICLCIISLTMRKIPSSSSITLVQLKKIEDEVDMM